MLKFILNKGILAIARVISLLYGADGLNILFLVATSSMVKEILNTYGAKVHPTARIKTPLIIHEASNNKGKYFQNLTIGKNVYIGRESLIDLSAEVIIEDDVCISHGFKVMTHTNGGDSWPAKSGVLPKSAGKVVIEKGAYLGALVLVLQGVKIGKGSLVAAGTLVNSDVKNHYLFLGIPGRNIKMLEAAK